MSRFRSTLRLTRPLCAAVLLTFATSLGGCDEDPCVKLERRVCKEVKDKRRCELIQQPQRREHLSSDACESMLKALKR